MVADTETGQPVARPDAADEENVHNALVLGLRDYFQKCGFKSAVLGLSGGIDSAVVACLAVAALGPAHVMAYRCLRNSRPGAAWMTRGCWRSAWAFVTMSFPFNRRLNRYGSSCNPLFAGLPEDTTEENIQARLRGVILMALVQQIRLLLFTTGNKSELAVGYCTLYGDMCGGLAVISDVPKTMVYRLANWINRDREIIPPASLTKAPSAELRSIKPTRTACRPTRFWMPFSNSTLSKAGPWPKSSQLGFAETTVKQVIHLIDVNEYKRRQAAPGLKVTTKSIRGGRRFPIAQRYREA